MAIWVDPNNPKHWVEASSPSEAMALMTQLMFCGVYGAWASYHNSVLRNKAHINATKRSRVKGILQLMQLAQKTTQPKKNQEQSYPMKLVGANVHYQRKVSLKATMLEKELYQSDTALASDFRSYTDEKTVEMSPYGSLLKEFSSAVLRHQYTKLYVPYDVLEFLSKARKSISSNLKGTVWRSELMTRKIKVDRAGFLLYSLCIAVENYSADRTRENYDLAVKAAKDGLEYMNGIGSGTI